jgi:hypothetical protein
MKEYHLEPQSNIRAEAFANAPARVICGSTQAAEVFRRGAYRYRSNNSQYAHIELKLKDHTVLFIPRQQRS